MPIKIIKMIKGATMYDLQALKEHTNLLDLVGQSTTLRKISSTAGGEYSSSCPRCGGRDRFHCQPHYPGGGRWSCRQCSPRWGDAVGYVMWLFDLDFKGACEYLGADEISKGVSGKHPPTLRMPDPAYSAQGKDWQSLAMQAINICQDNLWASGGSAARDYLHSRGLTEETIRHFRLGLSPGAKFGDLWIPKGVLIPCMAKDSIWYIKVRLLPGVPIKCAGCRADMDGPGICPKCGEGNKYRGVRGNRPAAIFNGDDLLRYPTALFVEGEYDAMIAFQDLGGCMAVCTMGSATNHPDLATWGPYLMGISNILACYDTDEAGQKGLDGLMGLSERVRLAPLPEGSWKDINDYVLAGGDLWEWITPYLREYAQCQG